MVLSGLVAFVLLAVPQAAGPPGIEIGLVPVVRTTQPPAIDGQAEEAWSSAVKRRLEHSKGPHRSPGVGRPARVLSRDVGRRLALPVRSGGASTTER